MASSILDVLKIIATQVQTIDIEIIPIEFSVGRVSAENLSALFDLPRFDNSAMDGYAVKVGDASRSVITSEVIYAGDNPKMLLQPHHAIKIMTGAPIPRGCEAIVPIEDVQIEAEGKIVLPSSIKMHHFIRMAGEDIKKGSNFLRKGTKINAYHIASMASQGMSHITVYRELKVVVFGTGDELRPHYEQIDSHQLYNSNSPMFLSRSKALGASVRFIHTASDSIEALEDTIKMASDADIIITSGGVSVGDKDFTKEAFCNLGMEILVDGIDIKPGRPTVIGRMNNTIVVNLPGNPLASMVNYELFVRAIIRKMSGDLSYYHGTIDTIMGSEFNVRGGKYTVVLGKFDGKVFEPLRPQMPGMVSPMQEADGLIILDPDIQSLSKAKKVNMIPIRWEHTTVKEERLTIV
jgi:molybdopterin molybdotransferase